MFDLLAFAAITTGDLGLDAVLQLGGAGVAMVLFYRLLMKQMDKKTADLKLITSTAKNLEVLAGAVRASSEQGARSIEMQTQLLRVLERQLLIMENLDTKVVGLAVEVATVREDVRRLMAASPSINTSIKRPRKTA